MRSRHSGLYKLLLTRLRAARLDAGMTQVEAARAVQRPQSFISKCESGERRVDPVELLELAAIYGRTLGYFVGEAEGTGGASVSRDRPTVTQTTSRDRAARARPKRIR